jgi:hypothetical protein
MIGKSREKTIIFRNNFKIQNIKRENDSLIILKYYFNFVKIKF